MLITDYSCFYQVMQIKCKKKIVCSYMTYQCMNLLKAYLRFLRYLVPYKYQERDMRRPSTLSMIFKSLSETSNIINSMSKIYYKASF